MVGNSEAGIQTDREQSDVTRQFKKPRQTGGDQVLQTDAIGGGESDKSRDFWYIESSSTDMIIPSKKVMEAVEVVVEREDSEDSDRGDSCAVLLASSTPAAREYAEGRFIDDDEGQLHCLCEMNEDDSWMVPSHSLSQGRIQENMATSLPDCYISPFAYEEHEAYMSEIQLRRIVDKMATKASEQGTDGDKLMVKDGKTFSKFSKDALEIGEDVGAFILGKVRKIFDLNKGDDAVFRTRNGAPKIMTKFKDKPYSYELLCQGILGEHFSTEMLPFTVTVGD
jgi:hypothetical protein